MQNNIKRRTRRNMFGSQPRIYPAASTKQDDQEHVNNILKH